MIMLQIGPVAFSTRGIHYDKLKNSAKGEWARQKRFGRRDALQWTGEGEQSVTVSGTIYTDYFPGFGSLADLKALMPWPQMVVSGAGDVMGLWCITDVSNEQTSQDEQGRPGKVTFDCKLERYGEDDSTLIGGFLSLADGVLGGVAGMSVGLAGTSNGFGFGVGGSGGAGLAVGVSGRVF